MTFLGGPNEKRVSLTVLSKLSLKYKLGIKISRKQSKCSSLIFLAFWLYDYYIHSASLQGWSSILLTCFVSVTCLTSFKSLSWFFPGIPGISDYSPCSSTIPAICLCHKTDYFLHLFLCLLSLEFLEGPQESRSTLYF